MSQSLRDVAAAAAKTTAIFGALAIGMKKAVEASSNQIAQEQKLAAAIEATGASINIDSIKEYAAELQKVTTYGDEATIEAAGLLATFRFQESQIKSLLPVVQNLSSLYGMDLKSAAVQVGKAFTGSVGALSRYGITMSDAEVAAIEAANGAEKFSLILNLLKSNSGEAAKAVANTATGAMTQFKNATGDSLEIVGKFLELPVKKFFQVMTKAVSSVNDIFSSMSDRTRNLISTIGLLTGGIAALTSAIATFKAIKATGIFDGMGKAIGKSLGPLLAVSAAIMGIVLLAGALKIAWDNTSQGMKDAISKGIGSVLDWFSEKIRSWTNGLVRGFASMVLKVMEIANKTGLVKIDTSGMRSVAQGFDVGKLDLSEKFKSAWQASSGFAKDYLMDPLVQSFEEGSKIFDKMFSAVFGKFEKLIPKVNIPGGGGSATGGGGGGGGVLRGRISGSFLPGMPMQTQLTGGGLMSTTPKAPGFWDVFGSEMKGGAMGFATTALGSADFGQAISAGIGVIAGAMGTAIGGPAGGAIAQAAASGLESILQKAATAIFNSIVEPFISAFTDQRIQGVIEKSAPLAMIGSLIPVAAFLELSKSTTSYAKVQEKMAAVVDKVVKAMEPFWGYIAPVTEVFAKLAEALSPLVNLISVVFGNLLGRVAFDAIKMFSWHILMAAGLQVRAAQGFASSIEWLVRFIGETLASLLGDDFAASLIDAADGLADLSNGLGEAADALYEGANEIATMSYSMAGMSEQFRNMNVGVMDLSASLERQNEAVQSSTFNMPSGYRVGIPRFDAENPSLPVQQQQEATTVTLVVHIENVNTESEGAFWESVAAPMSNEEREALITAVPRSGISRWSR